MTCLTGCFDRRELDTLGIVIGVAIDKGEKEGDTEVTVQLANPSGGKSSKSKAKTAKENGESGADKPYTNVSGTGKNVNYIVREMQHTMSRRIYVAHSQVIVISEDQAKTGVRDCLDFFARAAEARMTTYVFVSKSMAKDILDVPPLFEKMPAVELTKNLKDQKVTSFSPIVTEFQFVTNIVSKTTSAVAPLVQVIDEDGVLKLFVAGSAVFKQSQMVGELDEFETRGLLYIKNKVKQGVLEVDVNGETATVEIRKAVSKVEPVLYTDGSSAFNIEVKATLGLGDQSGTFNLAAPENVPLMLEAAGAAIKSEIEGAVAKSKQLDADIFGFGDEIYRKYPNEWKTMQSNWDDLYQDVKVNVTVIPKADGSGRISKPLVPEGA